MKYFTSRCKIAADDNNTNNLGTSQKGEGNIATSSFSISNELYDQDNSGVYMYISNCIVYINVTFIKHMHW